MNANAHQDSSQALQAAFEKRDVDGIAMALAHGADAASLANDGQPVTLCEAVQTGSLELVKAMLAAGRSIDDRDASHWTPFFWAAFSGDVSMAQTLLDAGAEIDGTDRGGSTPLIWVAHKDIPDMARFLIASGADMDVVNHLGKTALHAAAFEGHIGMVQALLDAGADPFRENRDGKTPFEMASHEARKFLDAWLERKRLMEGLAATDGGGDAPEMALGL